METAGLDVFMEALGNKQYWANRETNSRTTEKAEKPGKAGSGKLKWGGGGRRQTAVWGKAPSVPGSESTQVRMNSQSAATWV